jgi:peptidylprolyl isomerase
VNAKHPARLDDDTATEVQRLLREEWLRARAQEHVIEAG